MENKDKAKVSPETSNETKESISDAAKAIELNKKTSPEDKGKTEEKEAKDAENWRNEG